MDNDNLSSIGATPLGGKPSITTGSDHVVSRDEGVVEHVTETVHTIVRPGILGRAVNTVSRNPLKSLGITGLVAGAGGGASYAYYARHIAGRAITVHAPRVAAAALRMMF